MLKTIYISILFLAFISCEKKDKSVNKEKLKFFYPKEEFLKNTTNKIFLDLDSFTSFSQLINKIEKISCERKTPVVTYENDKSIFNLIPMNMCSTNMVIWCPKVRNELTITSESIIIDYNTNISIDSLSNFVQRHVLNKGKEFSLSDSPRSAFFSIQNDSFFTVAKVKNILIEISESFNEINKKNGDSLFLNILIGAEKLTEIKPPPPPPKN